MKKISLPAYIASFLSTKDHKLNISFCCNDQEKGEMTALISLQNEKGEVVLTPFSQTGTYDSFNGVDEDDNPAKYLNGKGGLWPSLFRLKTVLAEADNLRVLEADLKQKKKALKEEEDKLKKAPKIVGNRCAGGLDETVLQTLLNVPVGDGNHKIALEAANLQTLLKAAETLKNTKGVKSKFSKVSSEIKKITSTTAEDMGHVYAPEGAEVEKTKEEIVEKGAEQGQQPCLFPQGA